MGAAIWTGVAIAAAVLVAGIAMVRLDAAQQACYFGYPSTPCPQGPDLLPLAFFGVPAIWIAGLAVWITVAAMVDRRRPRG